MSAKFCFKCGAALPTGSAFCPRCGTAVSGEDQSPEAAPPQSEPKSEPKSEPPAPTQAVSPPASSAPKAIPPPQAAASPPPGVNRNILYGAIAAFVALALVGGVLYFTRDSDPATAAGEVLLEPADFAGEAPFTPSVDTNTAPEPVRLVSDVIPDPDAPEATRIRSVEGAAPGLYGGTQDYGSCDPEQLIEFLRDEPQKATAWAAAQGITVEQIPRFVRGLTPVVLRADTRVTNHGYYNGRATPIQSVLEAGTAVLVDDLGQPRVKCYCGNPLAPPVPQTQGVRYTGDPWPGFRPTNIITIVNTTKIRITNFVLVDLADPGYFTRPPGVPEAGPPADGEILTDDLCDMFPEDCPDPNEPVLGTGDVQVTLRWYSAADLDLAVTDPRGETINFSDPRARSGGQLDVDSNGNCATRSNSPVENVFWPTGKSPDGTYTVTVSYYAECPGGGGSQNFELTVLVGGQEIPVDLQTLSADGTAAATIEVLGTANELQMALGATGTLTPGKRVSGSFEKTPLPEEPPVEEPPVEEPPPGEEPAEPAPMTLEEYCQQEHPEAGPEWEIGPENMEYTLCMHDPLSTPIPA